MAEIIENLLLDYMKRFQAGHDRIERIENRLELQG